MNIGERQTLYILEQQTSIRMSACEAQVQQKLYKEECEMRRILMASETKANEAFERAEINAKLHASNTYTSNMTNGIK